MDLSIQLEPRHGATQNLRLGGKLDTHTYGELDQVLEPLLSDAALTTLILDLAGLNYMSSAGIRSVFRARKALAARAGRLLVVHLQPQIRKVFDIVKAVPVNDIFASAADLDAYLDRMQKKVLSSQDEG